jgi:peptidoglycan/xylan/chitin deacetylase (PgdA/CDA1 family)
MRCVITLLDGSHPSIYHMFLHLKKKDHDNRIYMTLRSIKPTCIAGLYTTGIFVILLLLPSLISGNRPATGDDSPLSGKQIQQLQGNGVPVLCYHNIAKSPGKTNELWISELRFDQQMQTLYDSGFHTIVPAQLYDHLTKGTPLPSKPIMITFDDTRESHFSIAAPVLEKYGFRGVFFIMTVSIGKKNYLSEQQIKMLAESGHAIECHTYDHPSVKNIAGEQWEQQINKPIKRLKAITGKPVEHFAYPYGVWNASAITELKKRGIKSAYQLSGKQSAEAPLFTIKRMLVQGTWTENVLIKHITRETSQ